MPNTDHRGEHKREHVETSPLANKVRAEIEAMHVFLAEWLSGSLPENEEVYVAGFARRFEPGFVLISPTGQLHPLAQVTKRIRESHGLSPNIEIEIRDVVLRRELGGVVVATYEEWQRGVSGATPENARLSTVLLQPDRVAPGGFAWLHLHECWLPSSAA